MGILKYRSGPKNEGENGNGFNNGVFSKISMQNNNPHKDKNTIYKISNKNETNNNVNKYHSKQEHTSHNLYQIAK